MPYFTNKKRNTLAAITLLVAALPSHAAIQRVDFTMTGSGGETATGYITYDDTVVADGQAISGGGDCDGGPDHSIDYEISIVGGQVGPVVFNKANCAGAPAFCNVPDFTVDVNFFDCSADGVTGEGWDTNTFRIFDESNTSNLVVDSVSTPTPVTPSAPVSVPTLSGWATLLLTACMGLFAYSRLRRHS